MPRTCRAPLTSFCLAGLVGLCVVTAAPAGVVKEDVYFTADAGEWGDADNWSSGRVPGRFDWARIPAVNRTSAATLSDGSFEAERLRISGSGTFDVTGGRLSINTNTGSELWVYDGGLLNVSGGEVDNRAS